MPWTHDGRGRKVLNPDTSSGCVLKPPEPHVCTCLGASMLSEALVLS